MTKPPRPQKVTSACLFVGISCALLLFYVSSWLTSWNTLEIQDGLRGVLTDVDLDAVGMTTQGAIDLLRSVLMVLVVPLVAGIVFAVYASRGHLQSRVMLTVIAVIAALSFMITGGLIGLIPAAFAAYSIAQLWSRESRTWFAVVNGREPPAPLASDSASRSANEPVRPDPFAAGPSPESAHAVVSPEVTGPVPPAARPGLPSSVRTLALVTVIAAGLATAFSSIYLAVYLLARDSLTRAQLESPVRSMMDNTDAEIIDAMRVVAAVCAMTIILGVASLVAAWLVVRKRRFGHFGLTVLSGVTILMGLFTLVGLPWSGVAVWVIVLLRRTETRRWVGLS